MSFILSYSEAFEKGTCKAGGKGWNLSRLDRYKFNIPKGFIISTDLYLKVISSENINLKIDNFISSKNSLLLKEIEELILSYELGETFVLEIKEALEKNSLNTKKVAVRSSANTEDGVEHSFAGIHSSYLNLESLEEIILSIKKCFASLWTNQAIAYRENKNISHKEVLCAVVICEIIQAESAGVYFTSDPVTGRRDQRKINAVRGLGEKLVSGNVNPEDITITVQTFEIIDTKIINNQNILSKDLIKRLLLNGDRVFWALGDGQHQQDIEWVYDGEKFWIVQSRPITNLPYPTMEEIKNYPIMWSNGNFKDAIPGIQSTMSWSNLQNTIRHILYVPLDITNIPYPKGMEITLRFQGRMYFDLTFLQWSLYKYFNLTPYETNKSLGGHQPEIKVPNKISLKEKFIRISNTQKLLKAIKKGVIELQEDIKKIIPNYRKIDFSKLSKKEILEKAYELLDLGYGFAPKFQLGNNNAGGSITILETVLKKVTPNDYNELCSGLMAYSGEVTSAEQGYRIFDLAKTVLEDSSVLKIFKDIASKNLELSIFNQDSKFIEEFNMYLEDFGHRAVYEGEIKNPRWRDNPNFILEQVKLIVESGNFEDPRIKAKQTKERVENLLSQKAFWFRWLIKKLVNKAVKDSALREEAKSTLSLVLEPVRNMHLDIGRRLTEKGILEKKEDIFHLSLIDVGAYLLDEWDGYGANILISDRKKQDEIYEHSEPPDVIVTNSKYQVIDLSDKEITFVQEKKNENTSSNIIKGVGVSSGKVTGKVKIIKHPSESYKLEKGEILVAPSTDPGWTPLFLRASGIIMEVGGYLSHGAIVSREYGIPAVVNIPNILTILKDGQSVTIDGNKGEIIL
jgi:phosphohistidine swiveling domain-containing protein